MKLRYHLISIAIIFLLLVAPLFYIMYWWGYKPAKDWNDNSNSTVCLVTNTSIIGVECLLSGEGWTRSRGYDYPPRITATVGDDQKIQCYDGIAWLKLLNTTRLFDVSYGSYYEVNQTLDKSYRKGSYVGCVYSLTNTSDFELHLKETTQPLTLSFLVPGAIVVALIIWGVCVGCIKKKDRIGVDYE